MVGSFLVYSKLMQFIANWKTLPVRGYIVNGEYTNRTQVLREVIEKFKKNLEELGRFPVRPCDLRSIDNYPSPGER